MRTFGLLVLVLFSTAARAEIEPKYYAQSQHAAPEALTIEVESVDASICWFNRCDARTVTVKAKVKSVTRSATKLTIGQRITITYKSRNMRGMSGPRPIGVLKAGESVPAFLQLDGAVYHPAAEGASFEPLIKPRR